MLIDTSPISGSYAKDNLYVFKLKQLLTEGLIDSRGELVNSFEPTLNFVVIVLVSGCTALKFYQHGGRNQEVDSAANM